MILTGAKIKEEIAGKRIVIEPFLPEQINPNSYNYRLGPTLKEFVFFDGGKSVFKELSIPQEGYVLEPGRMYLANTQEIIGSSEYAMSLIGRSSMGRYGLFLQVSANLGHTTSMHRWTLEIVAALPIRVYPGMVIGQVSFWKNFGPIDSYVGVYGRLNHPQESYVPTAKQKDP